VSYIQTLSGKKFSYQFATADDIDIEDIANASLISAALLAICQSSTASLSTLF
jgi:hypothetical protein